MNFHEFYYLAESLEASVGSLPKDLTDLLMNNQFRHISPELYEKLKTKNNLTNIDVKHIVDMADDKLQVAHYLGSENIEKLNDHDVKFLIFDQKNESVREQILKLLVLYKKNLNSENIKTILMYAADPAEMLRSMGVINANLIEPHHLKELKSWLVGSLDFHKYNSFIKTLRRFRENPTHF